MLISVSKDAVNFDAIEVATLKDLAQEALSGNFSPAVFRDGYRNRANFVEAQSIGLDFDNDGKGNRPTMSLTEAKLAFASYRHIIMTSRNHLKEKNGLVTERFRVILFFDKPITVADDFYATWHELEKLWPAIDPQCKNPDRFYYKHGEIISINESGKLVTPTKAKKAEAKAKATAPALPGVRGELSKYALKVLEFGLEPGSRNGEVYKLAKEFQQALYPLEEAADRIVQSLQRNDVIASDFTEREARGAVKSAYSTEAKHEARLEEKPVKTFNYVTIEDVLSEPDTQEDWLIEGMLLAGGISLIAGPPKVGKTTFVRQLELSVLRGKPLLGRKAKQGTVLHFSFDEKKTTVKRQYRKLGVGPQDPLVLHFGGAMNDTFLDELEADIVAIKPKLIVVDTLFDMMRVNDVNNYGEVKRAFTWFSTLAEKLQTHIMFIHHANKGGQNYTPGNINSVLGSTAIAGAVDCYMLFEKQKDSSIRILTSEGRDVVNFDRQQLDFDQATQSYSIKREASIF